MGLGKHKNRFFFFGNKSSKNPQENEKQNYSLTSFKFYWKDDDEKTSYQRIRSSV
jgi:hypothetical protein